MANDMTDYTSTTAWFSRWHELQNGIENTRKLISGLTEECDYVKETVDLSLDSLFQNLLQKLSDFSESQFLYFYYGFMDPELVPKDKSGKQKYSRLCIEEEENEDPHPRYVLRRTFDQLALDYEKIQQAYFSRKFGTVPEKKALSLADQMAKSLLYYRNSDGSEDSLLSNIPRVISFFDVSLHIRILPYDDVVLIGIPYTFVGSQPAPDAVQKAPREFLLLGHEMGHLVFRDLSINGIDTKCILEDADNFAPKDLKDNKLFVTQWLEEVFADVFGVMATGKAAIFSVAKEEIDDNLIKDLFHVSGTHPIDAVRPYIYGFAIANVAMKLGIADNKEAELLAKGKSLFVALEESYINRFGEKSIRREAWGPRTQKQQVFLVDHILPAIKWLVNSNVKFLLSYFGQDIDFPINDIEKIEEVFKEKNSDLPVLPLWGDAPLEIDFPQSASECPESKEDQADETASNCISKKIWKHKFFAEGWSRGGRPGDTHATGGLESIRFV